jgi:hypothetical protein
VVVWTLELYAYNQRLVILSICDDIISNFQDTVQHKWNKIALNAWERKILRGRVKLLLSKEFEEPEVTNN